MLFAEYDQELHEQALIQEAEARGRAQGEARGEARGVARARQKIARKLIESKLDKEFIIQSLSLKPDEILLLWGVQ